MLKHRPAELIDYIEQNYRTQGDFALAVDVHTSTVTAWKDKRAVVINNELYLPCRKLAKE